MQIQRYEAVIDLVSKLKSPGGVSVDNACMKQHAGLSAKHGSNHLSEMTFLTQGKGFRQSLRTLFQASRVAQWSKAVPPEILGSSPGSVAAGPWCTIGPASSGLGRVWPAGISLSHCALVTPVPGAVHQVVRCTVFPLTRWCSWLLGWMCVVSRSSVAWLGCVSEDAGLSTFASPESVREFQR